MKNLKSIFAVILLISFSIFISGCEGEEDEEETIEESGIYFRLVQKLTYPDWSNGLWCDMVSGNFKDNNPGVPDNAQYDYYYGPLEPGTYNASQQFDASRPESNTSSFTYTLESPPAGYKRLYTKTTREFYPDLNRCVDVSTTAGTLTYVDVAIE